MRSARERGCIFMREILLPALRYSKSSRGTPRLRHAPRTLHGAARLAAWTTTSNSGHDPLRALRTRNPGDLSFIPSTAPLHEACGGTHSAPLAVYFVRLTWAALSSPTEIRLFDLGLLGRFK